MSLNETEIIRDIKEKYSDTYKMDEFKNLLKEKKKTKTEDLIEYELPGKNYFIF
jgi:hypothetical protein